MQGARDWLKQWVGPQDALFLLHAALLVFGLGAVQPLSGLLAYRAWRWFLFLSAITQAVKVHFDLPGGLLAWTCQHRWCPTHSSTGAPHATPGGPIRAASGGCVRGEAAWRPMHKFAHLASARHDRLARVAGAAWNARREAAAPQVYLKRGLPRLRPFSLAALREWGAPLSATSDFQYLLYSLLLLQCRPLALVRPRCLVPAPFAHP